MIEKKIFSLVIFLVLFIFVSSSFCKYTPIKIISISNEENTSTNRYTAQIQHIKAYNLLNHKIVALHNFLWHQDRAFYNINVKVGHLYIANVTENSGNIAFYNRWIGLLVLVLLFFIFLIYSFKTKIIRFLTPLLLIFMALWFGVFYFFRINQNIDFIFWLFLLFSVTITYIFVSGFSFKSFVSIGSVLINSVIVYHFTIFILNWMNIKGLSGSFASFLIMFDFHSQMDAMIFIRKIIASGITISALGAGMDIAMSISSSLEEQFKKNTFSFRDAYTLGLQLIEHILPTMLLTLFFIYLINIMFFLVVITQLDTPMLKVFHFDFFIIYVLYFIFGFMSLILNSLLTIVFFGLFFKKMNKVKMILTIVLSGIFVVGLIHAWIEPPDTNFRLHPLTRYFVHKKTDFFAVGRILSVKQKQHKIVYEVQLLSNEFKNSVIIIQNFIDRHTIYYHAKQKVLVWYRVKNQKIIKSLIDTDYKLDKLYLLLLGLSGFVLLVLRKTGLKFLILIFFFFGAFYFLFIPLLLHGSNPFVLFIVFVMLIMIMATKFFLKITKIKDFVLLNGAQMLSFFVLFVCVMIMSKILHIYGTSLSDLQLLHYYNWQFSKIRVNVPSLVSIYLIAGSVGGLIDMSISLFASNQTLHLDMKSTKIVGLDMMGTMINTFFLGFTGNSLGFLFSLYLTKPEFFYLMNMELFVMEVIKNIVGVVGLFLSFWFVLRFLRIGFKK